VLNFYNLGETLDPRADSEQFQGRTSLICSQILSLGLLSVKTGRPCRLYQADATGTAWLEHIVIFFYLQPIFTSVYVWTVKTSSIAWHVYLQLY